MEEIITTLNKILPVVVKVHKDSHPELVEVGEAYFKMMETNEMAKKKEYAVILKTVTKDFEIPSDACPTYTKAYHCLKELCDLYA